MTTVVCGSVARYGFSVGWQPRRLVWDMSGARVDVPVAQSEKGDDRKLNLFGEVMRAADEKERSVARDILLYSEGSRNWEHILSHLETRGRNVARAIRALLTVTMGVQSLSQQVRTHALSILSTIIEQPINQPQPAE